MLLCDPFFRESGRKRLRQNGAVPERIRERTCSSGVRQQRSVGVAATVRLQRRRYSLGFASAPGQWTQYDRVGP